MTVEPGTAVTQYFAEKAWLDGAWAPDVLLSLGQDGRWCGVQTHVPPDGPAGAVKLSGPALPGLVNAHSHAFQRAIAGLTECRSTNGQVRGGPDGAVLVEDDFWSWRDRMYSAANRITPTQLEAIATLLYAELLIGGYTHVCEFHYLHNAPDGKPYADPMEMSLALMQAASTVGIGLTLLPTLYMRSGFGAPGLRADQRRFASSPDSVLRTAEGVMGQAKGPMLNAGIAVHSLRAVDALALNEVTQAAAPHGLPIHIHVAEQMQEVTDCFDHAGQRPIEWLLNHAAVDARWNLVHATHTTPGELEGIKNSRAAIVICPSTEANLGDGVFDFPGHVSRGGNWSVGSDSHVTRSWPEELRLLEYSQRLTLRKRNIAASVAGVGSTAAAMFEAALAGGKTATSLPLGGFAVGNRADFCVLDCQSPALLGVPDAQLLDAFVFSSPTAHFSEVIVAGRQVVREGRVCGAGPHATTNGALWPKLTSDFADVMKQLWT